jgi:hypothetical protein
MKLRRILGAALLVCVSGCHALAQQQDESALQENLYQDALRSIAEGRRNDASLELRRLIENEPQHAGAWLELALMQCALGHSDEAERLFAVIETRFLRDKPNSELLRVISEAREEGCNRWHASSATTMSIGRGVDQNVNQGALDSTYLIQGANGPEPRELTSDFMPMHDQYTLLSGDYSHDVSANGTVGFAQYAVRRNDRLHQYDSGSLLGGVETPWRFGRWSMRGSLTGAFVTLGGSLYQRQVQAQARIQPPLPLPAGMQFNVLLSGAYNGYLTLTNFNSNVFETRGILSYRMPHSYASVSVGRLRERALAQRPGGDREGWFGGASVRRKLGEGLGGEVSFSHQAWQSASAYAPGVIDQLRNQRTSVVRAALTWAVDKNQSIVLEGRAVRNRESISIFQYNDRQLQLSWQWQGN